MESAALQYKLELVKAGQDDGRPSPLSPAERLAILKEHQAAWTELVPSYEKAAPMLTGQTWELYGGVFAQGQGQSSINFRQLPSAIRGIDEKEWSINDIGFEIRDFGIDPAQNLLVAIQMPDSPTSVFHVHLRDIYTSAPHSAAPNPAVLTLQPEGPQVSYTIQISGDYLGVLVLSANEISHEVVIWNWKTGVCKLRYIGRTLETFTFLSERHVLLGLTKRPLDQDELRVLRAAEEPNLMVVDFLASSGELTNLEEAEFVCAFHYPAMLNHAVPLGLTVRSDPAPNWAPHPDSTAPFYTARGDRLLVITFTVYSILDGHTQLLLFVRTSSLLAHVEALRDETKHRFRWDEWGPSQTRMMRAPRTHSGVWVCYVFGMKFVTSKKLRGKPKYIEVYDFNQFAGDRRAMPEPEAQEDSLLDGRWTSRAETKLPEGIFGEEVTTSLPYRMRVMLPPRGDGDRDFQCVMLSEDTFIIMSNDENHRRNIRILTF
ncbi:hypothetical protein DAEQUDRAFT_722413 [Daedalea quercina L-15889]|uniref:F-box domain-containing protein n=1 Tax=Daedalea quercina L-15889 TaxID=1314783 RepID=A0A165T1I3_9APHY|nr:hypothetical protein DAEQUDRAFT_722413 [Daedalea quercina L-15889]